MFKKFVFSFFLIFSFLFAGFSEKISVPGLTGRVVDRAGVIKPAVKSEMTEYLRKLEDASGVQLAVLTVNSTGSYSIEEFATAVFDRWQLGQKGKDNGILLVVAVNDRNLRIETGYGMEGILTDAKCGLIIRNFITPYFKEGNYSAGIFNGVKTIGSYATGDEETIEKLAELEKKNNVQNNKSIGFGEIFVVIFWIVFLIIFLKSNKNNRGGPRGPFFMGGGFYGPGGGHGGFGGGGGFSGGGGRSGGGGASGHW